MMRTRVFMIGMVLALFLTGSVFAQMGGGSMGPGGGHMGGGLMGGGMGSGMAGAGAMMSGMMGNTMDFGYLDLLNPIKTPDEAWAAIQTFIEASKSSLQISALWEYGTVYEAELSDTKGAKAFDIIADKFTGAVAPEMGMSMMLNASYGKGIYKTPYFGKTLTLTQEQASAVAQTFVDKNELGYILGSPETYPGYYKFHTSLGGGKYGMDIMVNGYNAEIWMNTILGLPVAKHY